MPSDCYKINIVHFKSPNLIWVEIRDPAVVKEEGVLFEQIGLHGVLPMEKTLRMDDSLNLELECKKCDKWIPAATSAIEDLLNKSDKVWFTPIYIDKRPSIFDNNIHKHGEIIFRTKNGKIKKLSKHLVQSGFAYYDVSEFYEKLRCGQIKTKLCNVETEKVINEIKNYYIRKGKTRGNWENYFENQTTVFRMWQNYKKSLENCNFEKGYYEILSTNLEKKFKDFELCKDINEPSVGRAYTRTSTPITANSDKNGSRLQFLIKKLALSKNISVKTK